MPFASLSGDPSFAFPEFTDPPATPMAAARAWLATADDVSEPLSMTLATAADGIVSARTVDVKRLDDDGLVFGSSTESPKGRQLAANPAAALQVYWRETMQQMRFEGTVVVLPDEASDALFADRSPKSRAATAVARQSAPLDGSFDSLLSAAAALEDAARPASWVAYRLEPVTVEFWHGSRDRMHRRLQYRRSDDGWTTRVLQP